MCVRRIDFDPMMAGAGGDQQICRGNGKSGRPGPTCKVASDVPYFDWHVQLRENLLKLQQDIFLPNTTRSIPQLKANDGRPTCLPGMNQVVNPAANRRIAPLAEHLDPTTRVDQNHIVCRPDSRIRLRSA